MTRKRLVKLLMSVEVQRNEANRLAQARQVVKNRNFLRRLKSPRCIKSQPESKVHRDVAVAPCTEYGGR